MRLLSNLIKSNFIYVNSSKEIIDSDTCFKTLAQKNILPQVNDSQNEIRENQFIDGMNVVNMQRLIDEEQALIIQSAERTINEARQKAIDIVNQAKEEAQSIRSLAMEEGKKLGYVKGFEDGSKEIERLETELKDKLKRQEQDYQALLQELEPKFVDIISGLIEKLTNVIVEDQKGVILHLLNQAITNLEQNGEFIVWVSKEDFEFVKSQKDCIIGSLNQDVMLQILEDRGLSKNQCLIETNGHYIDCSLDIQLSNLIKNLKMLVVS